MGTIQNLLYNLESSRFPKNLLKKFKEKNKLAHESRELNKLYNWNSTAAETYINNLRPPCHNYANPKCRRQHPLITKYPDMPDNYKNELQNCTVGNRIIDEPIKAMTLKKITFCWSGILMKNFQSQKNNYKQ